MAKIVEVRNSTAEFLTFVAENKEDGVQKEMIDYAQIDKMNNTSRLKQKVLEK